MEFSRHKIILSRPDDDSDGELHRWRFRLWSKGPGIMIHRHNDPDPGRALHDHPWWFISLILRGGYEEEHADIRLAHLGGIPRQWRRGSIHMMRLGKAHRITRLLRAPTWTLIIHGSVKRKWGFYPLEGFVPHDEMDYSKL